jgi:hypothetical protein
MLDNNTTTPSSEARPPFNLERIHAMKSQP